MERNRLVMERSGVCLLLTLWFCVVDNSGLFVWRVYKCQKQSCVALLFLIFLSSNFNFYNKILSLPRYSFKKLHSVCCDFDMLIFSPHQYAATRFLPMRHVQCVYVYRTAHIVIPLEEVASVKNIRKYQTKNKAEKNQNNKKQYSKEQINMSIE